MHRWRVGLQVVTCPSVEDNCVSQCLDLLLCASLSFINVDNILASSQWVTTYGSANCNLEADSNLNHRNLIPDTTPADSTEHPWKQCFMGLAARWGALWCGWLQACQSEMLNEKWKKTPVLNTVTWVYPLFMGMGYLLEAIGNFPC